METLSFAMYPADTLEQARAFYNRPAAVEAVRKLRDEAGWSVRHNFHWGHMQGGFAWGSGEIDVSDYLDIWLEEIKDASRVDREEWPEYFDWLIEKNIAVPDDRVEFDEHFTKKKRKTATPRPGLEVARVWSFSEAEQLDQGTGLVSAVTDAFAHLKAALSA